jgi:hypothetical protein
MASPLLEFLGITDKKSYHTWCRSNHPDRLTDGDHDTTNRRCALVTGEWTLYKKALDDVAALARLEAEATKAAAKATAFRLANECTTMITDTHKCNFSRARRGGGTTCFYHARPENLRFVPAANPSDFFGKWGPHLWTEGGRSDMTCTARAGNGFCSNYKWIRSDMCRSCIEREKLQ